MNYFEPQRRKGAKKGAFDIPCSCVFSGIVQSIRCLWLTDYTHNTSMFFFAPLRLCGSKPLGVLGALAVQTLASSSHV